MAEDPGTRERILRTAGELFQRQGYHATGLNQVLAEGKAPKGSLYFHFPGGKEQLGAEAMSRGGAAVAEKIMAAMADATDPVDAIATAIRKLADDFVASGFRAGCPVATVALDVAADSELIMVACADAYRSWTALVTGRLIGWGVPPERAEGLATVAIAAVEGALVLARVRRDPAPLREVADRIGALVAAEAGPT
jgi:TetR/AcrR family transcriptional repressor of lmrAB and yxaGH operons